MSTKPSILVIDDDRIAQQVIAQCLEKNGFRVSCAPDGESGLAQLTDNSIDAVITDYMMPKLDGIGLLKNMKEKPIAVPLIMMTAHGSIPSAVHAMRLGAADYLTKPVTTPMS